ncbi:MAG TPA: MIP/aquaporin family protein [Pyrinomonadaceae bacterium]|nr:MIP/aquaporin family protein [Pyrinomonadaceae bacterium]
MNKEDTSILRRSAAEFIGTMFLLAAVVGSGIMAERLSGGSVGLALLANTIATGAALVALIFTFGPISGGHFNPAVSICDAVEGGIDIREAVLYVIAQIAGALTGVALANSMFELPIFFASTKVRTGFSQWLAEFVATFGLLSVIWGCSRLQQKLVTPVAVAAYIMAAYWFTSSTSFANPAVTIARSLSNTFAGIRPLDVPAFIVAQLAGAFAATLLFRWLAPGGPDNVVVPHE